MLRMAWTEHGTKKGILRKNWRFFVKAVKVTVKFPVIHNEGCLLREFGTPMTY